MRKVVFITAACLLTLAFTSCKESSEKLVEENSETIIETTDLALAEAIEVNNNPKETYVYVTAPSGLSLRQYNNLQSEKLGKMPYGTKVRIIEAEGKKTMTIGGIAGAMDEVAFNHKTGFAFNGYLSKYFPPEKDMTPKGYAETLQKEFPEVVYTETKEGTASAPSTIQTLIIPEITWHEAFMNAKKIFGVPNEFEFPNPKGKAQETIFDGKPKKGIWVSQLEVSRQDNLLTKIEYVYKSKKFDQTLTISEENGQIQIMHTEKVK